MTNEHIMQAAKLAIMQMSEKYKAAFIKLFEAGHDEICMIAAKGFALQGIGNQQILASKAMDNINALSDVVFDVLRVGPLQVTT